MKYSAAKIHICFLWKNECYISHNNRLVSSNDEDCIEDSFIEENIVYWTLLWSRGVNFYHCLYSKISVFDYTDKLHVVNTDNKMRCLNVFVELFLISYLLAKFASFATGQLKIRRLSQRLPLKPLRTKFVRGKHLCMKFFCN